MINASGTGYGLLVDEKNGYRRMDHVLIVNRGKDYKSTIGIRHKRLVIEYGLGRNRGA